MSFIYTDWEAVVKLSDDFNGADLRNVCTEAGKLIFSLNIKLIFIYNDFTDYLRKHEP